MPIYTTKRCQVPNRDWHYLVHDCDLDMSDEPRSGLTITYVDNLDPKGTTCLSVDMADALLIRDAINQLYPNC